MDDTGAASLHVRCVPHEVPSGVHQGFCVTLTCLGSQLKHPASEPLAIAGSESVLGTSNHHGAGVRPERATQPLPHPGGWLCWCSSGTQRHAWHPPAGCGG